MSFRFIRHSTHDRTDVRRSTRSTRSALCVLVATLSVAAGAAACSPSSSTSGGDTSAPTAKAVAQDLFPAAQIDPLVSGVVHKTPKELPITRLADGLVPPTNRWFSGLAFGDKPQPVFPLPLSFGLADKGFAFGQPGIVTTEKNIAGAFKADVTVDTGAASSRVSAYDEMTVTLDNLDGSGKVLGQTRIAEGSPFVSYTSAGGGAVSSALALTKTGDFWTGQAGGVTYGLVVSDGSVNGTSIDLKKGGVATWFPVPTDGSAEKLAALAGNTVTGSTVDYDLSGKVVTTRLGYTSEGDTAFATLPHQQANLTSTAGCDLGTYPSIYGTMTLCSGQQISYTAPLSQPTGSLDLGSVSGDDKKLLTDQVRKDIAALPAFPADTYFGGKALYRAAMLYRLAKQLGADDAAAAVKAKLTETLGQWTDPQGCAQREAFCFVYDEQAKGLVGLTPSFGSDEFNDHHFHYGYFLYAAGVLAEDDPALAQQYAPVMNLLAADIGSAGGNKAFPDRRVFDAYAGHSWASGTSPFADGNNQESSSEAVTAWTGLALWGKASDNAPLTTEATWMLSSEAQSGLAYWTNFDPAQPVYQGFGHKIVSLNWGGKRDYATWFSPEPAAMLGILVIPMSPSSTYLAGDPARIKANVAEATSGGKFDQKFGDYLLMYDALAGDDERKTALATAEKLDDKWIDDGNSRSYLYAWLMSKHS
ncbi:MAG: 1,3-beta-glucanase [Friedmanniella sp.]|nr:1,3-beta-glucanase [Friedmanniella sp.]